MIRKSSFGTGIALGVGIGAALCVALHNLHVWVALGAAVGVAFGLMLHRRRNGVSQ